jgi:hypothetical protein
MHYTNGEAFDMLMILGKTFQISTAASIYAEQYPGRQHYSCMVFQLLALKTTWQVQPSKSKKKQILRPVTDERSPEIIDAEMNDPEVCFFIYHRYFTFIHIPFDKFCVCMK